MSAIFHRIQEHWRHFRASRPGRRFQDRYYFRVRQKRYGLAAKWLRIGLGALIALAGVVMLAVPGPGTIALLVGCGLIAEESYVVARLLDRLELAGWRAVRWARKKGDARQARSG
jgi:hypothetical protein